MNPMHDDDTAKMIDDLETLLIALEMHPMFCRQPFKILRWNLRNMKTSGLSQEILDLKDHFAAMPDDQLFSAWSALHNPFRLEGKSLN
ncbi:MAG: hypothetical protein KC643_22695 [Nitrospira sp.]|uniref:hypothetical protein n=1 Tax=Accumulibacter sp. TaxID=2053492 RepID=UPI001DDD9FD8|nr:hypothetical protein [Accumulibacter sp.]MCA9468227.1 hypothetical protein [Nitrospira sp.]MCB0213439.1 hypothetical protein [Anaerolineae bacterium]MCP5230256.1 hypothetical protein [Accumulibacter sp.]